MAYVAWTEVMSCQFSHPRETGQKGIGQKESLSRLWEGGLDDHDHWEGEYGLCQHNGGPYAYRLI